MSKIDKKTEIALMASIDADETVGAKSDEAFKTIARDKFFLAAIMKGTIPEQRNISRLKQFQATSLYRKMPHISRDYQKRIRQLTKDLQSMMWCSRHWLRDKRYT